MEPGFRRTFWGITKHQFSEKLCPIAKIVAFESIAKIKPDNEKRLVCNTSKTHLEKQQCLSRNYWLYQDREPES